MRKPIIHDARGRTRLLAGCALGAVLAVMPQAASAQALQGESDVVTGSATITTGAGTTSVLVDTAETVINWVPFDTNGTGTIDFLPSGNTVFFRSNFADWTVLNRILPENANGGPSARAVSLNGNVLGMTADPVTFNRGSIYFFSPSGIIVGPTATFNVGSLILTTNDIQFVENCGPCESYGYIFQPGGVVQFRGPENSLSAVQIAPGAQINALGPNAYVAVVAPRVVHAGTVTANGNVAYVAAEQADVTINAGLFNIALLVGTTDPFGVVHAGTTTGPASTGYFADPQRITIAALSKNDALTMLLGGSLGYTAAANAFDDGSSIVLTAGNSAATTDSILIANASFGNRLDANAAGDITVAPSAGSSATGTAGGTTMFGNTANLFANRSVTVRADHGSTITALNSLNVGAYDDFGAGGAVTIEALGASGLSGPGAISITGGLQASASGFGESPVEAQFGGDGVGGSVALKANGGTIAADYVSLEAIGYGGYAELTGGDGTGGSVLVSAGYGGSITSQSSTLYATGQGGGVFGAGGFGGVGHGGGIQLTDSGTDLGADSAGGQLALGFLTLNASADGGYSSEFGSGHGGDAFGGTIDVLLSRQNQSFQSFYGTVNAHDGDTAIDPLAGTIDMVVGGGITLDVLGDLQLTANSLSGVNGGPAATGTGGTINLTVQAASTLNVAGSFYGEARADVAVPFGGVTIDSTATLTGGMVNVLADGGAINLANLLIDVSARNVAAADFAGTATGGTASVGADNGGTITTTGFQGFPGQFTLLANGYGDVGATAANGVGGEARLFANNSGTVTAPGATLFLDASARLYGQGFSADLSSSPTQLGGTVSILADGGNIRAAGLEARGEAVGTWAEVAAGEARAGTVTLTALDGADVRFDGGSGTGLLTLSADGFGSPGPVPSDAFGGTATLIVEDASVGVVGDIDISANGLNAPIFASPPDGPGFAATGGEAGVELRAGTLGTASVAADNLRILANGDARLGITMFSGEGVPPTIEFVPIIGDGGAGAGGTAGLSVDGGTLTVQSALLESNGAGGTSAASGSPVAFQSGSGAGGASRLVQTGGTSDITTLDLLSNGTGGGGGSPAAEGSELAALAGMGTGGEATLELGGAGTLRVTGATLAAAGSGGDGMGQIDDGDGSDGGDGLGGTAGVQALAGWTGSLSSTSLLLQANGTGGVGGLSDPGGADPAMGTAGDGGDGSGGTATIGLADGMFSLGTVRIEAFGTGGYSGDASSGVAGAEGGYGAGGTARFALIDGDGPSGDRGLDSLFVEASGLGGFGSTFIAQSAVGEAGLTVSAFDAAAALDVAGGVSVYADGLDQTPSGGIVGLISGAPLEVGGDLVMSTGGPLAVAADAPLQANGFVTLNGRTVITTGLIQSGAQMFVTGLFGIHAGALTSGATTSLDSALGPIYVGDLLSAGQVTAVGRSVSLHSSGGLDVLQADATAGDLWIETTLDLDVAALSATGSVMLESNAGDVAAADFAAGTFAYVDAFGTASLGNITAGTDVGVTTRGGNLGVGNVTAGDDIWLSVFGTNAASVLSAGDLTGTGLGDDAADGPPELFGGPGPAGSVMRVRGSGSLAIGDVQTPGRAILVADAGTTAAGNVAADEALIVLGHGDIALDAVATAGRLYVADSSMFLPNLPETYDPAALDGLVPVRTSGSLAIGSAVDAADITVAVGGNAVAPSWTSAGNLLIDAGGQFASTVTVTAGGNASITADQGIDLASLTSGGTTLLRSPLGTVDVDDLLSTGAVTARGRSVDIGSSGALSFADLDATAGNLVVTTTGNLTLITADSTGTTSLASSAGRLAASGAVHAGGAVSATAPAGVSFPSLSSGGTTLLRATSGAVNVDDLLSTSAVTARGRSIDIASSGALSFADLDATAGDILVATTGNLTLATSDATGATTLSSSAGSIAAAGAVNSGGAFGANGAGGASFASLTSGGTTQLTSASGAVEVDSLTSAGLVSVAGHTVAIVSPGSLEFASAESAGAMSIRTAGDLTAPAILAGGELALEATGGLLDVTGDVTGQFARLIALDGITIGGALSSGGNLLVDTAGAFVVAGPVSTGDATITATGGITAGTMTTGEITRLQAAGGNVLVADLLTGGSVYAGGRNVAIESTGGLNFVEAIATAGDVTILTDEFLNVQLVGASNLADLRTGGTLHATGDVTATTIDLHADADITADAGLLASESLSAFARGTFGLAGLARGADVTITSGDIALGSEARLGSREFTSDLTLINQNVAAVMNIGGAAQPGYSLDQAEAARLFADDRISIRPADLPLEPGYGRIAVGDLALTYSATGNLGTGGQLEISTPAEIAITGDVALTTGSADDSFLIDPTLIELDSSTGSIAMLGANGNPLGRLEMVGDTIAIASTNALTQLRTLTDMTAINNLLDTPGGTGVPLRAGTIAVAAEDALLIQNSGASTAFADRRGFAASGLEISTASSATRIVVNGQILTSGGPANGLDTAPLVRINEAVPAAGGQFDARSSINGCAIGADCAPVPEPEIPEFTPPNNDDIESPIPPGEGAGSLFVAPLIELAGTEPLITPPLVDEPITGVGNDDLWEPRCDPADEGAPCPEGDGEP